MVTAESFQLLFSESARSELMQSSFSFVSVFARMFRKGGWILLK